MHFEPIPTFFFCEKPCPIFLCTLWLLPTCWWNILNELVENPPPKKKHMKDSFQFADYCERANVFFFRGYVNFRVVFPKMIVNRFGESWVLLNMFFAHVWFTERQRPGDHHYQSIYLRAWSDQTAEAIPPSMVVNSTGISPKCGNL